MKRLLRLLTASAVVATIGFLSPSPAQAGTDSCTGLGTATISGGLGLPGNWRTTTFTFSLNGAVCVSGATSVTAEGTVSGACGSSSGKGTATVSNPHPSPQQHTFTWISEGTALTLTGQVTGTVSATEDPNDAPSCLNKNATNFNIAGSVAFTHARGCGPVTTNNGKYNVYTCAAG